MSCQKSENRHQTPGLGETLKTGFLNSQFVTLWLRISPLWRINILRCRERNFAFSPMLSQGMQNAVFLFFLNYSTKYVWSFARKKWAGISKRKTLKTYQNLPKLTNPYQPLPTLSKTYNKTYNKTYQNLPTLTNPYQPFPKLTKTYQNLPKLTWSRDTRYNQRFRAVEVTK